MRPIDEPRWISVLRGQCREHTQARVAEAIGYSAAVVSQVLSGSYRGDLQRVERAVRGAFLGEVVICPVLGEIPTNRCLEIQRQPYASTNPQRVRLYRACRAGCANSQIVPAGPLGRGGRKTGEPRRAP